MSDWIGRTVSKVTLEKLLGRGGMADVYLGRHNTLNRPVAVKILQPHLVEDEIQLRRFTAEAQAIAGLRHPHIVQVFDFDVVDERPYIVMELLPGLSLKDYLQAVSQQGQVAPYQVTARLFGQVAEALDYAHQRGIIHRDIKPANVMLRKEGGSIDLGQPLPDDVDAVLTDFGVARIADSAGQTASGTIIGTPAYMSPEQVQGRAIDPRSDIYSMGVMLYEMISGELPFEGSTQASLLMKHLSEQPRPAPNAPPEVQSVLDKALGKDPDNRHQTAIALANAYKISVGLPAGDDPTPVEFVPAYDENMGTMEMNTMVADSPIGQTDVETMEATRGGRDSTDEIAPSKTNPLVIVGSIAGVLALILLVVLAVSGVFGGNNQANDVPVVTEPVNDVVEPDQESTDLPESTGSDEPEGVPTEGNEVETSDQGDAAIEPEIDPTVPRGTITFTDSTMVATLADIAEPPDGSAYKAWLIDPENDDLSLGKVELTAGQTVITFTDPAGGNILAQYSGFVLSVESVDDTDPVMSETVAYRADVAEELITGFRLMDTETRGGPFQQSVIAGLNSQSTQFDQHLGFSVTDITNGVLGTGKVHAEHVINIALGEGSPDYGDWDGNGRAENPGNGVGLVAYLNLLAAGLSEPPVEVENQIEDILLDIQSAVDDAMRIVVVDTVEEAQPLALDMDEFRVQNAISLLVQSTDEITLAIEVEIFATP